MHAVLRVTREEQRLVESAGQKRERIDLPRDLHHIVVRRVLPGPREYSALLRAKDRWIGIHASGQRSRDANVWIDAELIFRSLRFVHRCYAIQCIHYSCPYLRMHITSTYL